MSTTFHKLVFCEVYSLWFSHRLLANPSQYIRINSVQKFSALFNNRIGKCCLHSFYYIFSIYFHCSTSITYHMWSEGKLTIPGMKVPSENIRSQEQKFRGTFIPGATVPTGNFHSEERKYQRVLLLSCAKSHMLSASRRQPHMLHVSAVDHHQIWFGSEKSWYRTSNRLLIIAVCQSYIICLLIHAVVHVKYLLIHLRLDAFSMP